MRIILILMAIILPITNAYYSSQPCDKLLWQLNDESRAESLYPECFRSSSGSGLSQQHASVKAAFRGATDSAQVMASFDLSFGSAMWLAWAVHAAGVEVYVSWP